MTLFYGRLNQIRRFCQNPFGLICVLYVFMAVPHIVVAYSEVGILSLELSSIIYYAIFIFFGYAALDCFSKHDIFIRCLFWVLVSSEVHYIVSKAYPLESIGVTVNGVSLFGHADSAYIYHTVGLAYVFIFAARLGVARSVLLLSLCVGGYLRSMERGALLGMVSVLIITFGYYRVWSKTFPRGLTIALLYISFLVALLILTNVDTPMLRNFRYQGQLAKSILGSSEELEDKEGTKSHRFEMWWTVIRDTIAANPILGQGVRARLVDVDFKNPHNSFLSIFGRFGGVGLLLAVVLYMGIPTYMFVLLRGQTDKKKRKIIVFYLCCVCAFYSAAFFGPTLVSPYSALVWNFIYGAMVKYSELCKQADSVRTPKSILM